MAPQASTQLEIQKINISDDYSFHMVKVVGGTYMMGDDDKSYAVWDHYPSHPVKLHSFWMGQYLVSQILWQTIMVDNTSYFRGQTRPMDLISWDDCIKFCNALSKALDLEPVYGKVGSGEIHMNLRANGYRMPTEAEWEYASRGGRYMNNNLWYPGSKSIDKVAWYGRNSYSHSHPPTMKIPNALGLFDISGNLWEWCWDHPSDDYYKECNEQGTVENPIGPKSGRRRVLRGGGWHDGASYCRVAYRVSGRPDTRYYGRGLRLARTAL